MIAISIALAALGILGVAGLINLAIDSYLHSKESERNSS